MLLFMDLETYSTEDLAKVGAYRYAEKAYPILWGYAIDKAPAKVWDTAEEPMPKELKAAWELACDPEDTTVRVVMHNGMMFDRLVLRERGFGDLPPEKVIDTMTLAYESALPGSLEGLCEVFKLPADKAKDKDGKNLIKLFCMPNEKALVKTCGLPADGHTFPEEWARFKNYCRLDVESMREVFLHLPVSNLTPQEVQYAAVDAKINDRGFDVDVSLAQAAVEAGDAVKARLAKELSELTDGKVTAATQTMALAKYITDECGYPIGSVNKQSVDAAFADEYLPEQARRILENRTAYGRSSVTKYQVLLNGVNADGRLRGTLQFRGASRTGRFSGRRFQGQNLPRPTMSNADIEEAINLCKTGQLSEKYSGKELDVLANLLRGVITAPAGKKLVVADYSNVEGRVLAWLAGADWKLQAFRDFDNGHGHDLYKVAYSRAFNVKPEDVTKKQRQVGKVLELALGYGGGASAFAKFSANYGIDLHEMAEGIKAVVKPDEWGRAYQYASHQELIEGFGDLDTIAFTGCEVVKRAWRTSNPEIVAFWSDLEAAFKETLRKRSKFPTVCGRLELSYVKCAGKTYVRIKLPSGRYIAYPEAKLKLYGDTSGIAYMASRTALPRWYEQTTWGGKLVENVTQAVACDLLCNALLNLEAAGYETVLTIHDEALCEVPNSPEYSVEKMEDLMTRLPPWAEGLPLVAAGFESTRYRKD